MTDSLSRLRRETVAEVLTGIDIPEDLAEGKRMTVIAQPVGGGAVLFRRKGMKTVLFSRDSPLSSQLRGGEIVSGTIAAIRENAIILNPEHKKDPIHLQSIEAMQPSGGPRPVGWHSDGRVILFHSASPRASDIVVGAKIAGFVYDEVESYVQLYAEQVVLPTGPPPSPERKPFESFPPVHPFVPWILNELAPASEGDVNAEVMGILGARTPWQAFEDLVGLAFQVLDIGELTQLGYKRTGERYPDGYIFCPSRKAREYLVLYDAKERASAGGYTLILDDERAYQDYLQSAPYFASTPKRAFVVVASKFSTEPRPIRGATLTFLTADVLAYLASLKVMNENLINHEVLESLLFRGRTVTRDEVDAWKDHHGLRDLEEHFPSK